MKSLFFLEFENHFARPGDDGDIVWKSNIDDAWPFESEQEARDTAELNGFRPYRIIRKPQQ